MKLSVIATLSTLGVAAAFSPVQQVQKSSVVMNAEPEQSRKAFLGAMFGAAALPLVASAGTMAQENVKAPTEQWETGKPTAAALASRNARYANARTQMNSNFAPIKRTNLERKSPVTRLDINAPNFTAYKKTYPGLYKTME